MICAKYVVAFTISCLLAILSEAEETSICLLKRRKWQQLYDWVFHSSGVLQFREDIEKPCNFAKKC